METSHGNEILAHPQSEEKLKKLVSERIIQPISATHVRNEVVFINPNVDLSGTDLVLGSDSDMGCQISLGDLKKHPDRLVYGMEDHNRSAILTTGVELVWHGQTFTYLDAKGTGYLRHITIEINDKDDPHYLIRLRPEPNRIVANEDLTPTTWGGASLDWIEKDSELSEKFHKLGVRTIPIVASIRLDELVSEDGKTISIEEAKQRKMITENDCPALELRAWVTPFRMKDIIFDPDSGENYGIENSNKDLERKKNILLTAIQDIRLDTSLSQELRDSFSNPENYAKWVAMTLGEQIGILHGNDFTHNYLNSLHNITLDARIMDLDSVLEDDKENVAKEIGELISSEESKGSLYLFFEVICKVLSTEATPESLEDMFKNSYRSSVEEHKKTNT